MTTINRLDISMGPSCSLETTALNDEIQSRGDVRVWEEQHWRFYIRSIEVISKSSLVLPLKFFFKEA